MATPNKTTVAVDDTAGGTEILPAGSYRFIAIETDADFYIDFVRDSSALTTANGILVQTADPPLVLMNNYPPSAFEAGLAGITATGTANLKVQYA